jgi:transposase InsO family protein
LSVSRSGYYEWRDRPTPPRTEADEDLLQAIRRISDDHKGRVGSPRITWALRNGGRRVGKNRVARLMRQKALRAKAARKYKATTNSDHNLPVAPNLLNQDFSAQKPNQRWVADITYLATDEGWLYSCRGARPLRPQSRGLGDVRTDDGETHL